MRLGIDASNIRAGGRVTHLVELLRAAAEPAPIPDSAFRDVTPYKVRTLLQCSLLGEPGFKGDVVAELASGSTVEVEREAKHWLFVKSENGKTGYVSRHWVQR